MKKVLLTTLAALAIAGALTGAAQAQTAEQGTTVTRTGTTTWAQPSVCEAAIPQYNVTRTEELKAVPSERTIYYNQNAAKPEEGTREIMMFYGEHQDQYAP